MSSDMDKPAENIDSKPSKRSKRNKHKRSNKDAQDDTPKSFQRLMEFKDRISKPRPEKKERPAPTVASIKKGESMADFSRRVNDAIPLPRARGVNSQKAAKTAKKQQSKAENLRQEYADRLRKKREQADEEASESLHVEDDGEDVWSHLNARNNRPKFGEVADRPPELPQLKRLSAVPKSAGSLARREILEAERERIIEHFRALKDSKQ